MGNIRREIEMGLREFEGKLKGIKEGVKRKG